MCTAVTYKTKHHYFGRNLDMECSYGETIVITPRNFPFTFRKVKNMHTHYAMIGMGIVVEDYPLYYDATNEKGLSMAGLNFPGNAVYRDVMEEKNNVSPFEFIPWILGQCSSVSEVREKLAETNLVNIDFNSKFPLTPLHWLISDRKESITVEPLKEGIKVYDNPTGVLTNSPAFDLHMFHLNNYMQLSAKSPQNHFSDKLNLETYSRGMGALGLPGDFSSMSRFVRAVFTKMNSVSGEQEEESVSQFFHILSAVRQQRGCVHLVESRERKLEKEELQRKEIAFSDFDLHGDKKQKVQYEITVYSSCCNTDKGIYYYTTYENSRITAVDMHREDLEGNQVIVYSLCLQQDIKKQN